MARRSALRTRDYVRAIGPGVVAGASDTDPTTVATIVVIGAGTTYELGWLTLLLFPLIALVQTIATRVGIATNRDLQDAISRSRGRLVRWSLLVSILVVNIVTIAADLEGGAAAVGLIVRQDWRWFVAPLSIVLLAVLLKVGYQVMQRALKYLMLCLLAYAVSAILAHPDWMAVLQGSFVPRFQRSQDYLNDVMSLLGTTLTGYVYFWQTLGQAEEKVPWQLYSARRVDAVLGSFFTVAVFWFILVACGATLGVHQLPVDTAQGAAQALRPLAGPFAGDLFAVGLLTSALIALPVIMATTAYATGAQLNFRRGLSLRPRQAPLFYTVLALSLVLGATAAYAGISPIRLLFIAGIVGAIGTPVGLVCLLMVAADKRLMGEHTVPPWVRLAGWTVTVVLSLISAFYLYRLITGSGP
ncbi:Nramp family divalent metal transporter [Amycolatopsis taiwanensis]|uniref:Iron transporter n=1 Tax=Amycolatopsis taiwanensis TaxID=342230 RepID=A0A9W6QZ32_9PSEU|nr:Nramp family divalent metal transporter [Amycolatopsis taiwanensis]GLY65490.1 iron transporter [Amycolatopsis taiwanensis]